MEYDIVIVGAGPTGLLLSVCLARLGYAIEHIDDRPHPTDFGRADGIQPRSLDLLYNLGLKTEIVAQDPGRFREVAFWDPGVSGSGIHRTGIWPTYPKSIGARYPFTTTLHQGIIERMLIEDLNKRGISIERPCIISDFSVSAEDRVEAYSRHPVQVTIKSPSTGVTQHVNAKYLFSGEGVHSQIRQKLGIRMLHKESSSSNIWGVVDALIMTDFPDTKVTREAWSCYRVGAALTMPQLKCNIHSQAGSMMMIPREAGSIRMYIQLPPDSRMKASLEELQRIANDILLPYEIKWQRVDWYSCYRIGQGIAEAYSSKDHRVFLGGDACHTHSVSAAVRPPTRLLFD